MLWPLSRTFVVEKGRLALIGVEFFFQAPMIFVRKVTKDLYYPFGEISNFDMRHVEYSALVGAMGGWGAFQGVRHNIPPGWWNGAR